MQRRDWLIKRRTDLRLTQRATADRIGISVQHYGSIENGTGGGHISLDVAGRIVEVLGIRLDEFYDHEVIFQNDIASSKEVAYLSEDQMITLK